VPKTKITKIVIFVCQKNSMNGKQQSASLTKITKNVIFVR